MHTSPTAILLTLSLTFQNVYADLNTMCYYKASNVKHTSPGGPCGAVTPTSDFQSCCSINDTCLPSGLCHYTHPFPATGNSSGYYVGGCTDPTLSSPACNMHCSSLALTDIVYNSTSQKWACCGVTNGVIHCDDPTTETFDAPAPGNGEGYYKVPSAVSTAAASSTSSSMSMSMSTSLPTTSATAAASLIATPSSSSSESKGLSTGAQAGIGVAAAVGGIFVIGLLVFAAMRHRRKKQEAQRGGGKEEQYSGTGAGFGEAVGSGMGYPQPPGYQNSTISTYTSMHTPATANLGGFGASGVAKPDDPFGVYRPREKITVPQEKMADRYVERHEIGGQEIRHELA